MAVRKRSHNQGSPESSIAKLLVCLGISTLLTQVLLIREANVWLRGNEFIIAAIVAAWLIWIASGSLLGYQLIRFRHAVSGIVTVWICSLIVSVAGLVLLRCFWTYSGGVPGESINLSRAAGLSFAVTFLPCLLSGSVFGGAVRWYEQHTARSVAYLYMIEALGAFIAGVLITFILLPFEHWWLSLVILAGLPFIYAAWTARSCSTRLVFCLVFILLCWGACAYNSMLETYANSLAGTYLVGEIVETRDTPRERITVITHGGEAAFYFDGRLCGSSVAGEQAEELGWYAALSCPAPQRALLTGFPFNGLIREFLRKNIDVTVVDTKPVVLQVLADYLSPADSAALTSQYVHILATDSREYMNACAAAGNETFDIILQDIGIPESYAAARLFSREWFSDAAACLSSNGACIVVLPGSAGYVPDELARILERIRVTMTNVFSQVIMIPASQTLLIGSQANDLSTDEYFWLDRWSRYNVSSVWFSTALLSDNLNSFRVGQFTNACSAYTGLKAHTDSMPLAYGDALRYSEARFQSGMRRMLSLLYDNPVIVLSILILLLILGVVTGWSASAGRSSFLYLWIVMSLLSAAGLIGEMMIIIRIVILQGSVTYSIGLLFGVFIFGLACAAFLFQHVSQVMLKPAGFLSGIILAGTVCLIIFMPWPTGDSSVIAAAAGLNLLCGVCVGTCFTVCARQTQNVRGTGITLYTADLFGAFTGGLLFSIVIPPALGFNYIALLYAGTILLLLPALLVFRASTR